MTLRRPFFEREGITHEQRRHLLLKDHHAPYWRRDWPPAYFWTALCLISVAVTVGRYWSPLDIYPYAFDDLYGYRHSRVDLLADSFFGARGPRPFYYLLLFLLHPRDMISGLLPESFPLWGYDFIPQIQYMIFEMAGIVFWLVPLAGYVAWRMTGSRLAGVVVGVLMALSPYQNLIAPTLEPQVIQLFLVIAVCYRVWCCDLDAPVSVRRRMGLITGLFASAGVMTNYHVWFFLVPLFPAVALYMTFAREGLGRTFRPNLIDRVRRVLPYALGVMIGLLGPLLFIDLVFRLNQGMGNLFYTPLSGTYSYFDAAFGLPFSFNRAVFSLLSWQNGMARFVEVVRHQIGFWGSWLLFGAMIWHFVRAVRVKRLTPNALAAAVVGLGFLLISLPIYGGIGRLTMPFEFLAYIVIVTAIMDVTSARSHLVFKVVPVGFMALMMVMHMTFTSTVVLDQLRGHGRAAAWLQENPREIYYANSPWVLRPKLSVKEARALTLTNDAYLIAIMETPKEWQDILKDIQPVRRWRNAYGAWRSFHFAGNFDYYWDHLEVYDLQEVIDRLNK